MAPKSENPVKAKKAWKGEKRSGPVPARHIPWPEIFKHHISLVEGHTKMLEMVQKHTIQGSGNYSTISDLVRRGFEMLRQAREISRTFIPPPGQREMVPLGSSSKSMYPGYSPAHIEYGKAAAEVGKAAGEMRARGEKWELPAGGPEYHIGQGHGAKRRSMLNKESTESNGKEGPEEASKGSREDVEQVKEEKDRKEQYFVIDTNPTPVALPSRSSKKRTAEDDEGGDQKPKKEKKKKKAKETEHLIETEDISAEVEALLKAKEDKAKAKEEKKRKRESMGDESEKVLKKSKKDKSKKRLVKNGDGGDGGANDGEEGEEKKKRLKTEEEEDVE